MQHKQKILNKENNWNDLKNYKPNDVVSDDGKLWQNVSGINTKPGSLSNNDWTVIDDSIDYAKIDYVTEEIYKIKEYAVKKINTIADLRNTVGEYEGQIIELLGYYEAGDKEPLNYKWTSTQGIDDGGSVINSGSGSWVAQKLDLVNIDSTIFGFLNENSSQDKLVNAINFAKGKNTERLPVFDLASENSMFYGVNKIILKKGKYNISESILIDNDLMIVGEAQNSVFLNYTGEGSAIIVNSDFVGDYTLAINKVNNFHIENINIYAPNAEHCITIGSQVYRWVEIKKCVLWGCNSFAINLGQAVYFPRISNTEIKSCGSGIIAREYTDLLTVNDRCHFANLRGPAIHIECATYYIENNDFEYNKSSTGEIYITNINGNNARNGMIFSNRFGNENDISGANYDIYIDNPNNTSTILNGISISGNNHTTKPGQNYTKTAPIYINCHVSNLRINNNIYDSNYSSKKYVIGGVYTKYNRSYNNTLDRLFTADNKVRGIFNNAITNRYAFGYQSEQNVPKYSILYAYNIATTSVQDELITNFRILTISSTRLNYDKVSGIALETYNIDSQNRLIAVATEGCVIETNLDLNSTPIGSYVYASTTQGVFTTIQPTGNSILTVGRTVDQTNKIVVDFNNKNIVASVNQYGSTKQSTAVDNVTTANATDLSTALTLVNELKTKLNAKLTADKVSGQQA